MENGMLVQEVSSNIGTNIDSLIRQISNKTKFLLKGMTKGTKLPGFIRKEDKKESIIKDSSPIEKSPSNIQSTTKQSQLLQQDESSVSPQRKKFDMQDKMKQFTKKRDSSADEPAPQAEGLKVELKDLQETRKQLKKAESKETMPKSESNPGQVNEFLSKFQKITQKANKQEDAIDKKVIPPEEQKEEKKVEIVTDNQPKQDQRGSVRLMPIGLMKEGSIFQDNIFLKDKLKPPQQLQTQVKPSTVKEKEQTQKVQQTAQRPSETQAIKESVSYQSQKAAVNIAEIQKTKEQKIDPAVSIQNSIHSSDLNSASMKSLESVVEQQSTGLNNLERQREDAIKKDGKTVEKQPQLSLAQRNTQQQDKDKSEVDGKRKSTIDSESKTTNELQQKIAQIKAKSDFLESQNDKQEIEPLDKGILSPFQMLKLRPVNKKQVDTINSVESNPAKNDNISRNSLSNPAKNDNINRNSLSNPVKSDNINRNSLSKPAINVIDASRKSTTKMQAFLENDTLEPKQTDNKPAAIPAVSGNSLISSEIIKNADSNPIQQQQEVSKEKVEETKKKSIHNFIDLVEQVQLQENTNAGLLGPTKKVRSDYGEDQPPQIFEGIPPNPLYSSSQQFDDVPDLMKSSVQSGNTNNLKTLINQPNILGNTNSNLLHTPQQQQYSQQQQNSQGNSIITSQLLNNPGGFSGFQMNQLSLQTTPKDNSNFLNLSPASQAGVAIIPPLESPITSNSLQNRLVAQMLTQQQQLGQPLNMQQQQILLNQTQPLQQPQYQQQFPQQSGFSQSDHPITYIVTPQQQQQQIQPLLVLQPNQLNFSSPQQFLPQQAIPIGYQQQIFSDSTSNLANQIKQQSQQYPSPQQNLYQQQQPVYQLSPQQVYQAFPPQPFQQSIQFQQGTPQGQVYNSLQSNQMQSSPSQAYQILPIQSSFQNPQVQPFLIQSPIPGLVLPQQINQSHPSQHSNSHPSQHSNASQFSEQRQQQQMIPSNISSTQDNSNFNLPTQEGSRQAPINSVQDQFQPESILPEQLSKQNIPSDNALLFQKQNQYSSQQGNSPPQSQYFSKFSFSHPNNSIINTNIAATLEQRNKYPQPIGQYEDHGQNQINVNKYQLEGDPHLYQDNNTEGGSQIYPPAPSSDSSRISRLSIHTIKTTQDQGRDSVLITDIANNYNQSQQQQYYAVSSQQRGSHVSMKDENQLKRQQVNAASSRQFVNSSHIDDLLHEANSLRSSKQPTQQRYRPQSMNVRTESEELIKIDQNIRDLEKSIDHLDDDLTQSRIHLRNKSQKDYSKAFMTKSKEISTGEGDTAPVTNRSVSSRHPRNQGGVEVKRITNKSIPVLETTLLSARKSQACESRAEEVNLTLPRNSLSQPRYSNSNKKGEKDIIISEFPTQRESYGGAAHLGFTSERSNSVSTKNIYSSQFQFVPPKKTKRVSVDVLQDDTSFMIANRFFQTIQRNPSSTQIKKLSSIIETQINAYCEELAEVIEKVEGKKLKERDTIQCFFRDKSITSPKQISKEDNSKEIFGQVKINYQDRQLILKVRNEDDPDELAFNFITENNLPKSKLNLLIQQIVSIQQQQRIKKKQKQASVQRIQQYQYNSPKQQQPNQISTTWKRAGWQKDEDMLKLEKRQMVFQFKFELGDGDIIDLCVYEGDNLSKLAFELAQTYKLSLEQYQRVQECLARANKTKRETSWQRVSKNI